YPNPFNPSTVINYYILSNVKGQTSDVKLNVYDVLGNEIKTLVNEKQDQGSYSVTFDGANLPSGIYFYKLVVSGANSLSAENYSDTKRMILLK
ncbi:MAG: T9SS type A sorting domain-containing protein, partial [bacterium]